MDKQQMYQYIEDHGNLYTEISDRIWDYAETAFEEFRSADCICQALETQGFDVKRGIGSIATAFSASYGKGGPVIGILGEFDALSGLSQTAGCEHQAAAEEGGNGHGCGHNMLGAAALAAAVAVKEYLRENGREGTVIYFGCPGEEGGSGKAFMAREGVFAGIDIAYSWHPAAFHGVMDVSMLANYQVKYIFKGIASHAAAAPHLGRSALDAVELMNIGVNFLREHVIQEARIHYAITNSGGFSPNVVQSEAEVLYLIRAPKSNQVEEIYQRINKIAQGAALMTETELEIDFVKACANIVPNKTLSEVMNRNFADAGIPEYTQQEIDFAARMDESVGPRPIDVRMMTNLSETEAAECLQKCAGKHLCDFVLPFSKERDTPVLMGSSDVGDVSWNVPTGQVITACHSLKTVAHSWQLVSQGRTSIAHKGLLLAAKVIAGAAVDALENPEIITAAKAEFDRRLDGQTYRSAIPAEVMPRPISKL